MSTNVLMDMLYVYFQLQRSHVKPIQSTLYQNLIGIIYLKPKEPSLSKDDPLI